MAFSKQKCKCGKPADFKALVMMYQVGVQDRKQKSSSAIAMCLTCILKPTIDSRKQLLAAAQEAGARLTSSLALSDSKRLLTSGNKAR